MFLPVYAPTDSSWSDAPPHAVAVAAATTTKATGLPWAIAGRAHRMGRWLCSPANSYLCGLSGTQFLYLSN